MNNMIINISSLFRTTKASAKVAKDITKALDQLGFELMKILGTNNYWCREYMPAQLFEDGVYSRHLYHPDYLWDYKSKHQYITHLSDGCKEPDLFIPWEYVPNKQQVLLWKSI